MHAYVDASFASEEKARSRVGWWFFFGGGLVSWCSENPTRVMTSSTEVECRALSQFCKESMWMQTLQTELKHFWDGSPTKVFEDNTSAISLSSSPGVVHKRSKHFGIEFFFFY